jgi:protein arginine kinase activator
VKCEKCKKQEATIHLSQTRQGKTTEHHLCEACAREQGISLDVHDYIGNMDSLGKVFGAGFLGGGSIFDTAGGIPAFGAAVSRDISCPDCGQSFDDFRRTGLLGCSHCYEAFAVRLDPVLRRVQGSTRHVGRKVCQSADQQEEQLLRGKLSELKQSLLHAVQEEAYETAARLRDEIRILEQRLCVEGGEAK